MTCCKFKIRVIWIKQDTNCDGDIFGSISRIYKHAQHAQTCILTKEEKEVGLHNQQYRKMEIYMRHDKI